MFMYRTSAVVVVHHAEDVLSMRYQIDITIADKTIIIAPNIWRTLIPDSFIKSGDKNSVAGIDKVQIAFTNPGFGAGRIARGNPISHKIKETITIGKLY